MKEEKCYKCGLTTPHYEEVNPDCATNRPHIFICNGCATKEWLDYMNTGGSWTKESLVAIRFITELEEGIYQRDQYIESLERQLVNGEKVCASSGKIWNP